MVLGKISPMITEQESMISEMIVGVLEKIRDNYPKIVLTIDEFQKIDRNGICSIYLPDFLLGT